MSTTRARILTGDWYVTTDTFERHGSVIAGPFTTSEDARMARTAIEKIGGSKYWIDQQPTKYVEFGNYDYRSPPDLRTRLQNLINWWRDDDSGDDEGSITAMCNTLERLLQDPK